MSKLLLIIHLVNGEVIKLPVDYSMRDNSCDAIFQQVTNMSKDDVRYNNKVIWVYYCLNKKGLKV
ncbi:MAG: hypothetical protein O3A39_06870 [Proteobacteria bacterium]|nr:hypothetical protein [Pseudomonadota bacterium]